MAFGGLRQRISKVARRIAGRDPASLRRQGNLARDKADWAAAATAYRRYLKARPDDTPLWVQLGHVLKEGGRLDEASAAYARAATLGGPEADLLLHQGRLARLEGDDARAARLLASSYRLKADGGAAGELFDSRSIVHLGQAFKAAGMELPSGRIEAASDGAATGWAIDTASPGRPAVVEFYRNGEILGTAIADQPRPDLAAAGLTPGWGGFAFEFPRNDVDDAAGWSLEIRVKSGRDLSGSPCRIVPDVYLTRWLARASQGPSPWNGGEPWLSIVMPVHDPDPVWLDEAVASVAGQDRGGWELICVDDGSTRAGVGRVLEQWQAKDPRIHVVILEKNIGIAGATNAGIQRAKGRWLAFMDHDDRLEPEAVRRVSEATEDEPDLIYTDEVLTWEQTRSLRGFSSRGAFSHDFYLSHPYFVHLVVVRRDVAIALGGLDRKLKISADVDFVLRVLERARTVCHLPAVLYRWRTHATSQGHRARAAVAQATAAAIGRHLARLGHPQASVSDGPIFNTYRIDWPVEEARTLAVIPTRDRVDLLARCLDSLRATAPNSHLDVVVIDHESREAETSAYLRSLGSSVRIMPFQGPFNFSRMNNEAVRRYGDGHDRILFLNNDIEAHEAGWFERLSGLCSRSDVGVAGATLLYPDRRVQHAGVVIGLGGFAEHVYKFAPYELQGGRNPGPECALVSVRDVSAVTAACMMMRRKVFDQVGGFDESLAIGFNDTDLCLRVGRTGLKILNDGLAVLLHHESATRRKAGQVLHPEDSARFAARWETMLARTDPYYSPFLSSDVTVTGEVHLGKEFAPRLAPGPAAIWQADAA